MAGHGIGFQSLDTILGVTVDGEFIPVIIHHVIRYMGGIILCFITLEIRD